MMKNKKHNFKKGFIGAFAIVAIAALTFAGFLLSKTVGAPNVGDGINTIPQLQTYKSKVSSNDSTPGYLNGKLVAGANITLTENNDGGNETLTIAGSASTNSFETISTPAGSSPVADSGTDTLTLSRTEQTVTITGTAGTDTVNFHVPGSIVHQTTGSSYEYLYKPASLSGTHNTFYGVTAGDSATSAAGNAGFGSGVLTALTTGINNAGFGTGLGVLTTGSSNNTFGNSNLNTITTQSGFTAFGNGIFNGTSAGGNSAGIGADIGGSNWTPNTSTIIGRGNINGSATGAITGSTIIGNDILFGSGTTVVGATSILGNNFAGADDLNFSKFIGIGVGALETSSSSSFDSSIFLVTDSISGAGTNSSFDVMIGSTLFSSGVTYNGSGNIILSSATGSSSPSLTSAISTSLIFGSNSSPLATNFGNVVIMGGNSTARLETAEAVIVLGEGAMSGPTEANNTISIGRRTLQNISGTIEGAVVMGGTALQNAAFADNSTVVGNAAANSGASFNEVSAFGYNNFTDTPATGLIKAYAFGSGIGTTADTNSNIVLFGNLTEPSSSSSTNEMAVGSGASPITRYWFGNGGLADASPDAITFSPTDAVGTGIAGASWTIASGAGTGAGTLSSLIFQTPTTASGSTLQSLATRLTLSSGSLTVADAHDFVLGSTTGTKFGTATSQKIGFFNATPIVQPSGNILTALSNLGLVNTPTVPASSVSSGAALTKADDTNVTLTLGGTPSTSLLAATSITAGWTGTLAKSRGGTASADYTTATETFTNKRITKRVVALSDATSATLPMDTADMATMVNTQAAGTFTMNAPSGTPTDGQQITFRIDSTNVQTFSWNGLFRGSTDYPLPTATSGGGLTDYYGFIYNSADTRYDIVAATKGF